MDTEILLEPIWAMRHSVRISDGFSVAAARALQVPLLTADAKLSRAPIAGVSITVVR